MRRRARRRGRLGGIRAGSGSPGVGSATAVALGNFDEDARLDVGAFAPGSGFSTDSNTGDGTFAAPVTTPLAELGHSAAAGDFGGDGLTGAVGLDASACRLSILRGDGSGGFVRPTDVRDECPRDSLSIGDRDYDGLLDVDENMEAASERIFPFLVRDFTRQIVADLARDDVAKALVAPGP